MHVIASLVIFHFVFRIVLLFWWERERERSRDREREREREVLRLHELVHQERYLHNYCMIYGNCFNLLLHFCYLKCLEIRIFDFLFTNLLVCFLQVHFVKHVTVLWTFSFIVHLSRCKRISYETNSSGVIPCNPVTGFWWRITNDSSSITAYFSLIFSQFRESNPNTVCGIRDILHGSERSQIDI